MFALPSSSTSSSMSLLMASNMSLDNLINTIYWLWSVPAFVWRSQEVHKSLLCRHPLCRVQDKQPGDEVPAHQGDAYLGKFLFFAF